MPLLIGFPFSQLSSVSRSLSGTIIIGEVDAGEIEVESCCELRRICLMSSFGLMATDASGAVDELDEHAASMSVAAPTIVFVIDLVMFFMVSSIF